MKPFLSILIPARNRCEYLRYAIQSAINLSAMDIEIIVSENHSTDDSLNVCNSFNDKRLKIIKPPAPLAMHENFEFLLKESTGEWVTFIGDDDAVMPHCVEHLKYLCEKFPQAEAIASRRANYFWNGCQERYGDISASFEFWSREQWRDSKKQLQRCLDGKTDYIYLPQMYSGGFHRRSLINRTIRAQNGQYFKSVTPDAYSALMACIHTYRYLETGMPMTWVGSSPHQGLKGGQKSSKDRMADFFGMHKEESLTMHKALGDLTSFTFSLVFYESFISAFPLTPYGELSMDKVRSLYFDAVIKFSSLGNKAGIIKLSKDLGFKVPSQIKLSVFLVLYKLSLFYKRSLAMGIRLCARLVKKLFNYDVVLLNQLVFSYTSKSHQEHPNILSCDSLLAEGYARWMKKLNWNS